MTKPTQTHTHLHLKYTLHTLSYSMLQYCVSRLDIWALSGCQYNANDQLAK